MQGTGIRSCRNNLNGTVTPYTISVFVIQSPVQQLLVKEMGSCVVFITVRSSQWFHLFFPLPIGSLPCGQCVYCSASTHHLFAHCRAVTLFSQQNICSPIFIFALLWQSFSGLYCCPYMASVRFCQHFKWSTSLQMVNINSVAFVG